MTTLIFPEVNDLYFQLFVNLMGIVYGVYGVGMIKKVSHSIQFSFICILQSHNNSRLNAKFLFNRKKAPEAICRDLLGDDLSLDANNQNKEIQATPKLPVYN